MAGRTLFCGERQRSERFFEYPPEKIIEGFQRVDDKLSNLPARVRLIDRKWDGSWKATLRIVGGCVVENSYSLRPITEEVEENFVANHRLVAVSLNKKKLQELFERIAGVNSEEVVDIRMYTLVDLRRKFSLGAMGYLPKALARLEQVG